MRDIDDDYGTFPASDIVGALAVGCVFAGSDVRATH